MAKYTTNEVLNLVFEKPANEDDTDEDDSEDDFDGYVQVVNTRKSVALLIQIKIQIPFKRNYVT